MSGVKGTQAGQTVRLRTKPAAMALSVVVAGTAVGVALMDPGWVTALFAVFFVGTAVEFLRREMVVADGVVYRRGWFRWAEPLLLDQLREVHLYRSFGARDHFPERRLRLTDRGGTSLDMALITWDHWRELARCVAEQLVVYHPGGMDLRLAVDDRTARFLAEFLPASGRPGTSDPR